MSATATWAVLVAVLAVIASGRARIELAALSGLLLLGLSGTAPPAVLFSGYGDPALVTIIAVFLLSQGIVDSGLLRGLGQSLAHRVNGVRSQVMSTALVAALLSAFMNNVGAVGLVLPTAVRMAGRCASRPGTFGLPLAMAAIIGGTMTLIGSAPNIIIASYMMTATGQPFRMFDYAPHGLAMLATALLLWLLCKSCGIDPGAVPCSLKDGASDSSSPTVDGTDEVIVFAPLGSRDKRLTGAIVLGAIALVSLGQAHPALGFGAAALTLIATGILKAPGAYRCVDLSIVFFLGAMLGMSRTLEYSGALDLLAEPLRTLTAPLGPGTLVLILFFVSTALSNAINNAAAAVFMAPLALSLTAGTLQPAAALMAVAAGANLTLLLPTHQATLMVMSKAPFSTGAFMRFGLVLTLGCGLAATAVILLVWHH